MESEIDLIYEQLQYVSNLLCYCQRTGSVVAAGRCSVRRLITIALAMVNKRNKSSVRLHFFHNELVSIAYFMSRPPC